MRSFLRLSRQQGLQLSFVLLQCGFARRVQLGQLFGARVAVVRQLVVQVAHAVLQLRGLVPVQVALGRHLQQLLVDLIA